MLQRALTCASQHTRGGGHRALGQFSAAPAESLLDADGHGGAGSALSPGLWLHCDLSTGSVDGTAAPGAAPAQEAQGAARPLGSVTATTPQLLPAGKWGRDPPQALALALS